MMNYESAKRFVVSVIAAALQATVAVVDRILPYWPDWLERFDILAAEFRAVEDRGSAPPEPTPRPPRRRPPRPDRGADRGAYRSARRSDPARRPTTTRRG